MDQRLQFIADHQRGHFDMRALCARYGVSRKTGYKSLARYAAEGPQGLHDRSHVPHTCPHRIDGAVAALLLEARRQHSSWGPAKLVQYLAPRHAAIGDWPAVSTVADLLTRQGLVARRRRPVVHVGAVPNDLWTADFKGQLSVRVAGARRVFERAFREFGLPRAIRTDNGVPFANTGLHGLTQLSVWWLRLGIQHQRIRPASPQENGAHERMHRTLKAATTRPPAADLARQQRVFHAFQREYNTERPHAALDGDPPAARYGTSARPYPRQLPPLVYPGHFLVKRVTNAGTIRFKHKLLFLANAL